MVTRPSIEEVLAGYQGDPIDSGDLDSSGDFDSPDDAERLILEAVSMYDSVFSDQILYQSEGQDDDNAVRYLARHKWAIALGDTVESESQAGANASYSLPTSTARSLGRTEYGQELLEYFAETPNISTFRTR